MPGSKIDSGTEPLNFRFDEDKFCELLRESYPYKKVPAIYFYDNGKKGVWASFSPLDNIIAVYWLKILLTRCSAGAFKRILTKFLLHEIGHWHYSRRWFYFIAVDFCAASGFCLIISAFYWKMVLLAPIFLAFGIALLYWALVSGSEAHAVNFEKKMRKSKFAEDLTRCIVVA